MPFPRLTVAAAALGIALAAPFGGPLGSGPAMAQTAAPAPADSAAPATQEPATLEMDESTVVARVGDATITLGQIVRMHAQLPAQYRQAPLEAIYVPLLDRAISRLLVSRAARASGVGDSQGVKAKIREAEDQVLAEAYLTTTIASQVTEASLRERYEAAVAGQGGEEEAKARHILLENEADARAVVAELDGGADFAKLAEQKSTGPSAASGGDLGWFKAGQMVPEFSAAAFALEPGKYTADPVQSQFGWHVILLEEKRVADAPTFEQMQEQLASDMTRELIEKRLAELHEGTTIEKFGPSGQPLPAAE